MAQQDVIISLRADDKATGVIGSLRKHLEQLGKANSDTEKRVQALAQRMREAGSTHKDVEAAARSLVQHYNEANVGLQKLNEVTQKNAEVTEKAAVKQAGFGKALLGTIGKFTLLVAGITLGLRAVATGFRNGIRMAEEYNTKLIGLQTIASNFGISQTQILDAVQRLTSDGLMSQATAIESLTNIFSSYVTDVDQAVGAIEMFKDFAASGGKGTLSFEQKVKQLSEAFLTEMSILGNNAGMQENWNEIIKIGENVTGKKYEQMSKLEKQTIKLAGVTAIHARAQGAANQFSQTHVGIMQMARTNIANVQLELGKALIPALAHLAQAFNAGTSGGKVLIQAIRGIGVIAMVVATQVRVLATAVAAVFRQANALIHLNVKGFVAEGNKGAEEMKQIWKSSGETISKIWKGEVGPEIQGVLGGIPGWADDAGSAAGKAMKKMMEQLKKETEGFNRAMEQRTRDFRRSLADLVFAHKDKVADIQADLQEETASFMKENAKRLRDLERTLDKMEKAHERKIRDTNQDIEDEYERHASARDKIEEEIRQEQRKGIYMFGQWNSQADADRLKDLQKRLDDEERQHAQKLRDLQQNLDDEVSDYQDAVDEKKMLFEEETDEAQKQYEEKKSELERNLAEEQAILARHAEIIGTIKDLQKEDDITRLIRGFEEEKAEMERQHKERMEEIVKQGEEAGSGYAGGVGAGMSGISDPFDQFEQDVADTTGNVADTAANNARSAGENTKNIFSETLTQAGALWELFRTNVEQSSGGLVEVVSLNLGFLLGWIKEEVPKQLGAAAELAKHWLIAEDNPESLSNQFKALGPLAKKWLIDDPNSLWNQIKAFGELASKVWEDLKEKAKGAIEKFKEGFGMGEKASQEGFHFQHGGVVPGSPGQAVPIMAHGGERVVPRSGVDVNSRLGGGITINMSGPVSMNSERDIEILAEKIVRTIGRRNELERLGVGM